MKPLDDFEGILNDALSEYRDAEPLAGLEDRILRRLEGATRSAGAVWRWALGLAAVAAMVAVCAWLAFRPAARRDRTAPQIVQTQPQPERAIDRAKPDSPGVSAKPRDIGSIANHRPRPNHATRAHNELAGVAHAPEREQFPSPAPLDQEERALLALARAHPDTLRSLAPDDTELNIQPIAIAPLEQSDSGAEGDN